MKKILIITMIASTFLVSCKTAEENPNTAKGAGIGAAAGALLGAVIGNQTGQRDKGAAMGAILGAGVGGLAGNRLDRQKKELDKIAETKRTEQGLVTKLKSDILFDSGKTDLKSQAKTNIRELATIMKKYPENVIKVLGYTDSTGSNKINNPLSEGRAKAVESELVSAGIPATTVSHEGMGSSHPVDQGKTSAALAKNRRVEIEITVDESKIPKK